EARWFEFLNRALFDAEGRLTGYQTVGRDVTEWRAQAAEIERQREALFQSEKVAALGSLLAGVAHELNNPLSVVVGRATMLEDEATAPAMLDSLGKLRAAADRCAKIVRSFLALARQERGLRCRSRSSRCSTARSTCWRSACAAPGSGSSGSSNRSCRP